jgi:hypothetical protein
MTGPSDLRYGGAMVCVSGPRRLLVVLAAAMAVVLVAPMATLGRAASPDTTRPAATANAPFTLDLSASGDFVAQANFVQCVGASMQMMLNVMRPKNDGTAKTQLRLQDLARSLSGLRPDGAQRKGASVIGWTAGLNLLGAGPYRTVGLADLEATLKLAARAMLETGRPVGLLVWRGRHAWVMAGFTATADPRLTDDFEVTRVIVLDPLYPYGSKTWGASPKPRESLTVAELGRQFVPRGMRTSLPGGNGRTVPTPGPSGAPDAGSTWSQALAGKYVIVMPFTMIVNGRLSGPLR